MTTLLVKQILKDGSSKTWKLRPSQQTQTFGSSRLANLISISPTSAGIEAVFEFKNNAWSFHQMNAQSIQASRSPSVTINEQQSLSLSDSELVLTPVAREQNLLAQLEQLRPASGHGKTFQLFIAKQGDRVVDLKLLPLGKKYKSIPCTPSQDWTFQHLGNVKVQQRSVEVDDMAAFSHLTASSMVDNDSRKGVYVVLAMTVVVLLAGLFGPKSEKEVMMTEIPKMAQKIIVKTDLKKAKIKKTQTPEKAVVLNTTPTASAPKTADTPSKGGKVANMLKSLAGGRISQLIGKVSSQAAKSANVVVSNGIKAGQAGSGRALAALGSVERSGRDWGTESNGKDVVVSTAGRGGGKNASGMGGLAAGSTGNAGVGLIEEESEIVGGLDREVIAQYIKSQLGQILYCYERQLSASPDLFGKVAVKFTISGNGGVEQQLIGDTTLKNATVEGCILNRVAAWKFPAPQGGTKVLVTYPFLFKSTN